jgi:hypothetical protein
MVTISIAAEAFAAIETRLSKGSKAEARPDGKGGLLAILDRLTLDKLKAIRSHGERPRSHYERPSVGPQRHVQGAEPTPLRLRVARHARHLTNRHAERS